VSRVGTRETGRTHHPPAAQPEARTVEPAQRFADRRVSSRSTEAWQGLADRRETTGAMDRVGGAGRSGGVVQRQLALHGTAWTQARSIKASSGGGGGILIISDGQDTLAVKPNVSGAEEELSAWAHSRLPRSEKEKSWNLGTLGMRIATAADVLAIQGLVQNPPQGLVVHPSGKLNLLLQALAAGTTMIQEFAPAGTETFGRAMSDQAAARGGHLEANAHAKVVGPSPLKPLLNKPDFARSLGKTAAVDILMGNFDRLVGSANLENFMINLRTKRIYLIDNVGLSDFEKLHDDVASARDYFLAWTNKNFVQLLRGGNVAALTHLVWGFQENEAPEDPVPLSNYGVRTFSDELLGGSREEQGAGGANQQFPFMATQQEATRLKDKLVQRGHLTTIRAEFQKGLVDGLIAIVHMRGELPDQGPGTQGTRRAFRARAAYLAGEPADTAWPPG